MEGNRIKIFTASKTKQNIFKNTFKGRKHSAAVEAPKQSAVQLNLSFLSLIIGLMLQDKLSLVCETVIT